MIAISIIMPVYNSEQYLPKAIDSILSQTYKNFELIIINDGSTDRSGEICDYYAETDERIIVIHQKNTGISGARNKGLSIAKGEYIAFADNDDECAANLLEENYILGKKYDADIVKFGVAYYSISEKEKIKVKLRDVNFKILSNNEISNAYLDLKNQNLLVYVWDSLFKKSLIEENEIYFNSDMKYGGEDIDFNLKLFPNVKKMIINPTEYYTHYKRYSHSTAVLFNRNKLEAFVANANLEYKTLRNLSLENLNEIWAECMSVYLIQIVYGLSKLDSQDKVIKKEFLKNLSLNDCFNTKYSFKELLNIWRKNKKRSIVLFLYQSKFYTLLYLLIFTFTRKNR